MYHVNTSRFSQPSSGWRELAVPTAPGSAGGGREAGGAEDGGALAGTLTHAPLAPRLPQVALPKDAGSTLVYLLAQYSLNGTYLGVTLLDDQLQLCTNVKDASAFTNVGTSPTCNEATATAY